MRERDRPAGGIRHAVERARSAMDRRHCVGRGTARTRAIRWIVRMEGPAPGDGGGEVLATAGAGSPYLAISRERQMLQREVRMNRGRVDDPMDARLQVRVQRYGWDRASGVYDRAWSRQLAPAQSLLLEMASLESGEEVVELACGSGLVTRHVARAVGPDGRVLATDLSDRMLELARGAADAEGLRNVTFERADAGDLDLPPASFDVALSALGLMYVPDPGAALGEMLRVLRPGGRAVAAVWGERKRCGWAEIFPIVDARVETEVCPLFFQLGTGETLAHEMARAGFEDVELRRISTVLEYDSPAEALEAAFDGGPVAMAYSRFDEETRREAHQEYLDSLEPFRVAEGYRIPGEFVVARGGASALPAPASG